MLPKQQITTLLEVTVLQANQKNMTSYQTVLEYWFETLSPKDWFRHAPDIDVYVKEYFSELHADVIRGAHLDWRTSPKGRLAEIIVLDQFSRHIYRDSADAYVFDEKAQQATLGAINTSGVEESLSSDERLFLYMPLMHSESKELHELAVQKYQELGKEEPLKFEQLHKRIIDEFGRYPHRNEVLGRETTDAEQHFLDTDEHASF